MSRFYPTVVTAKAMSQLGFEYNKSKEIPQMVKQGLERLYSQQNESGGWGWWPKEVSHPEMTAYVLEGLHAAKQLGYGVDQGVINRGRKALADLVKDPKSEEYLAYTLYVLQKTGGLGILESASAEPSTEGKAPAPRRKSAPTLAPGAKPGAPESTQAAGKTARFWLDKLYQKHTALTPQEAAYLAMTFGALGETAKAKTLMQELELKAKKINGSVYWGRSSKHPWENDELTATAVVLRAYLQLEPQNPNVTKAARWLALNRREGSWWESTKTTAKVVLALVEYLKVSRELWPDYNLKVELNGRSVAQRRITRQDVNNPEGLTFSLKDLKTGKNEIILTRDGPGVLYYSLLAKYFTKEENIAAKNYPGLKVSRQYQLLKSRQEQDKVTYSKSRLPGEVKSGSDIYVTVTVEADQEFRYFMLEDYIPAGCEIIEKVERFRIDQENYYDDYDWHWWYAGREAHDNRMAFFATYLPKGKSTFTYILKAQIPGDYHVMPTEGSLMYFPTVRAVGKEHRMKIVD